MLRSTRLPLNGQTYETLVRTHSLSNERAVRKEVWVCGGREWRLISRRTTRRLRHPASLQFSLRKIYNGAIMLRDVP
jgi:hypothetical protein